MLAFYSSSSSRSSSSSGSNSGSLFLAERVRLTAQAGRPSCADLTPTPKTAAAAMRAEVRILKSD